VIKKDLTQRALLLQLAKGTLRTKVHAELADHLSELVVDAVETIRVPDQPIDLHMVEIMCMQHKSDMESMCVKGLVLDHGPRHPDMKKRSEKCFILTCNVSLEYEKSEVNSGFYYSTAQQRESLVDAERKFTDDRVRQIIELKRKVVLLALAALAASHSNFARFARETKASSSSIKRASTHFLSI
jgi:T-complex protein 1 subunit zeta